MEAVIFWWPAYRVAAIIKIVTAAASWLTVIALIPILPRALAIPTVLRSNEILKAERQERERVIASLAEREARYSGIVNAAVDAILTIDEQGIIDSANQSSEKLFGWSQSELIGKNVSMLMPPPDADRHDGYLADYCRTGEARIIGIGREVQGLRRDGSRFPAELAVSEVQVGGRRLFTGIVKDISRRRTLEQERENHIKRLCENNETLVRKNRELDEFTYVASHDLQEPLRKLTAFSELLQKDAGDGLPEKAKQDLAFITNAARRMGVLIRDLLSLSRAGRTQLIAVPTKLSECVSEALHNLAACIEESGAKIECADLPTVSGDSTMLTQLYQNLIGNAIKYRAKERPPLIRLTSDKDGDQWQLGVSDNGIGMESQYFKQVFEPFKRLHGKDQYEGSGIGLSVCQKIVEKHGGRIWVDSTPGEGSHFRFTLEAVKEDVTCKKDRAQQLSC